LHNASRHNLEKRVTRRARSSSAPCHMMNQFLKTGLWARMGAVLSIAVAMSGCIRTDSNSYVVPAGVSKVLHVVPEESLPSAVAGLINDAQYSREDSDAFRRFTYLVCGERSVTKRISVYNGADPNETYLTADSNGSPVIRPGANNIGVLSLVVQVNDLSKLGRVSVNGTEIAIGDFQYGVPEMTLVGEPFDAANRLPGYYAIVSMGPLDAGEWMNIDITVEGEDGLAVHFDAFGDAPCAKVLANAAWHGTTICIRHRPRDLSVESLCATDPLVSRRFRVTNPNSAPVSATWRVLENGLTGSFEAAPGTSIVEVNSIDAVEYTFEITYLGDRTATAVSSGERCDAIVELDLGHRCTEDPMATRMWLIYNSNAFNMAATWDVNGTLTGSLVLTPGENVLITPALSGVNTLTVRYEGGRSISMISDISSCYERPELKLKQKCTDNPETLRRWEIHYTGAPVELTWELSDGSASGAITVSGNTVLDVPVTSAGEKTLVVRFMGDVIAMSTNTGDRCVEIPELEVQPKCVRIAGTHYWRVINWSAVETAVSWEILENGATGTWNLLPGENYVETPGPTTGPSTLVIRIGDVVVVTATNPGDRCYTPPKVLITGEAKCVDSPETMRRWRIQAVINPAGTIEANWAYADGSASGTVTLGVGETFLETPATHGGAITLVISFGGVELARITNNGETCQTEGGCTLTKGYWRTHHEFAANPSQQIDWPAPRDESELLCGQRWIDLFYTESLGNAWTILSFQWMAASLNVANGASVTPEVQRALDEGRSLLLMNCGRDVSPSSETGSEMVVWAGVLDAYNNGRIGPGHCDSK
jgi:hypothetical protein